MKVLGVTNTGKVRTENEDCFSYGLEEKGCWAVVCDGVGGTAGGKIASNMAVQYMERALKGKIVGSVGSKSIMNMIEIGICSSTLQFMEESKENPALSKMATTMVGAVMQQEEALLFWIGDSRAYLLRGDSLTQLTVDHSVVQLMVNKKEITAEQAEVHPMRNMITNSINTRETPLIAFDFVDLQYGDWILLCSDGVNDYIPSKDLPGVVATAVLKEDPQYIVDRALEGGGGDNITAVLMAYERR